MRLSERTIRELLQREAEGVSPPDDLWDRISRELERHPHGGGRRERAQARALPVRAGQLLALGMAAGILWFLIVPARPVMEWAASPSRRWSGTPPFGPVAARVLPLSRARERTAGKAASDLRWTSPEIALLR